MQLRQPTLAEVREIADGLHLELPAEELESIAVILDGLGQAAEAFLQAPEAPVAREVAERSFEDRPAPERDPWNAIVRRCSVRGASSGALAGKRIGVKDTVSMAGIPLTCGSRLLEGFVPDRDATIVRRMLAAGAEIVAVLNMDDMAVAAGGDPSAYGPVRNPHDPDYLAGGSSGGSAAALFYDDIDLTIGGDQGGSIRIPSSWCGSVGLKPTHGLVPYTGVVGADATLDHVGPMTRSVEDLALLLEVLAGRDPDDPRQGEVPVERYRDALGGGVSGLRVGLLEEGFEAPNLQPDVDAAARGAVEQLAALGAKVVPVSVPAHRESGALLGPLLGEGFTSLVEGNGVVRHQRGSHDPALAAFLGSRKKERAHALSFSAKLILVAGAYLRDHTHGALYARAQNARPALRAAYDRALQDVDLIAMPTTPTVAHRYQAELGPLERMLSHMDATANTAAFDITGHPALSLPCGRSGALPVGLMLLGRPFDELTLLRAAHALEQRLPAF